MKRRLFVAAGIASVGSVVASVANGQGAGVWLVTAQEAALPPSTASKAGRSITRGPAIRQISPDKAVAANKPFDLHIDFAGRGGEKINAASVQIAILRGGNVDITSRLKPFVTEKGIEMPAAMVPPGTHVLQVTVADAGGRQTVANVEIDAK
jgi:hypothetical protein